MLAVVLKVKNAQVRQKTLEGFISIAFAVGKGASYALISSWRRRVGRFVQGFTIRMDEMMVLYPGYAQIEAWRRDRDRSPPEHQPSLATKANSSPLGLM
jgi:hypothetical protein